METVDVIFVGWVLRVGVNPDFGDGTPAIESDETMARALREFDGFAQRQDARRGGRRIGRADTDADGAANDAPKFGSAVVMLPREAPVRGDEKNFWTALALPRGDGNIYVGKVSG